MSAKMDDEREDTTACPRFSPFRKLAATCNDDLLSHGSGEKHGRRAFFDPKGFFSRFLFCWLPTLSVRASSAWDLCNFIRFPGSVMRFASWS
jgi:hypothetical protein